MRIVWRPGGALLVAVLAVASAARAELCLPSLAEQGRRLHEMPAPSVLWLVTAHAMKDMLIVHESLRYHPDLIVYGAIPNDYQRYLATDPSTGRPDRTPPSAASCGRAPRVSWRSRRSIPPAVPFIDLSRTLLPRDFLDTLHPNARRQRKIAGALAPQLAPIVARRIAEVLPAEPH